MTNPTVPYKAVIKNKVTGETMTGEVLAKYVVEFDFKIKGCTSVNLLNFSDWGIKPEAQVPTGLGAVVEGKDGKRYIKVTEKPRLSWCILKSGELWGWASDNLLAPILRDGGSVLSEGVKDA